MSRTPGRLLPRVIRPGTARIQSRAAATDSMAVAAMHEASARDAPARQYFNAMRSHAVRPGSAMRTGSAG